jgi:hypothetical protein
MGIFLAKSIYADTVFAIYNRDGKISRNRKIKSEKHDIARQKPRMIGKSNAANKQTSLTERKFRKAFYMATGDLPYYL